MLDFLGIGAEKAGKFGFCYSGEKQKYNFSRT